ncbi:glycoside hydrolase family 25 domain-containing protein [Streptacidiphilus rugosus]|uniref:hypothetical protein n=1 Tax=Streptacidiphilus rugosus TaxID=405783 RepID=UPI0006920EAD|nr:hypothetical protein [Streptacidiphilus rugosus]
MTRIMYDAVTAANVPAGATLVAGYGDGYYANVAAFRSRFPHATIVEIAVSSSHDIGVVLDVETGDATPEEAPGWVRARRAAGVDPTVYCNSSTWPEVRAAFRAQGVAEPHWWIAQYDGDPTIFPGAVAKQYADPGPYDLSSVADYWPGVDPQEDDMPYTPQQLVQFAQQGAAAALQAERATAVADNLWWWQHALAGEVPASASPAAAAAIQAIHAAMETLKAEPAPAQSTPAQPVIPGPTKP